MINCHIGRVRDKSGRLVDKTGTYVNCHTPDIVWNNYTLSEKIQNSGKDFFDRPNFMPIYNLLRSNGLEEVE